MALPRQEQHYRNTLLLINRGPSKTMTQQASEYAHELLKKLAPLSEEALSEYPFQSHDFPNIGIFLFTMRDRKETLSEPEALTLLRLVPIIADSSRTTAHTAALAAARVLKASLEKGVSDDLKQTYIAAIQNAGTFCFRGKMRNSASMAIKEQENELLIPFIQDSPEYIADQKRVKTHIRRLSQFKRVEPEIVTGISLRRIGDLSRIRED